MAAALFVTIGTPAAIAGPSDAVSPTFALRDLGTFPGQYISHAAGINDAGQVVGYAQYGIYSEHSVLWENGKLSICRRQPSPVGIRARKRSTRLARSSVAQPDQTVAGYMPCCGRMAQPLISDS